MADDWQVGDLALCVGRGEDDVFDIDGSVPLAPGPVIGLTYTVAKVTRAFDCYGRTGTALALTEIPQRHARAVGYNAALFQKADAREADEFDLETIALLTGEPILASHTGVADQAAGTSRAADIRSDSSGAPFIQSGGAPLCPRRAVVSADGGGPTFEQGV